MAWCRIILVDAGTVVSICVAEPGSLARWVRWWVKRVWGPVGSLPGQQWNRTEMEPADPGLPGKRSSERLTDVVVTCWLGTLVHVMAEMNTDRPCPFWSPPETLVANTPISFIIYEYGVWARSTKPMRSVPQMTTLLVHGQVTITFVVSVCVEFFSAVCDPISILDICYMSGSRCVP